jgi:tRNA uridine 5-carboxymethylaminomethyl modification enzyme
MTFKKLDEIDFINEVSSKFDDEVREQAEVNIKYRGYIEKEKENVAKLNRLKTLKFRKISIIQKSQVSAEAKQKMTNVKPKTIAQAGRISGVSPADINVLLVYLGR